MGGIAKGKVEGGIESRLEALRGRKVELEAELQKVNYAMDQIGVLRDELLVGEEDES